MLGDIQNKRLIVVKGLLFLVLGVLAGALVLANDPQIQTLALLGICVWGFCRFYYFAFYVIQKYVDPKYRFTGLLDFFMFLIGKGKAKEKN